MFSSVRCATVVLNTSLFEHINTVHETKRTWQAGHGKNEWQWKTTTVYEKDKPFKCTVCGVGFAIEDTLKRHILFVHEGEKTFKCRECDSTFIDRSS